MKKRILILTAALTVASLMFAGGILTNTNQHVSFLRMLARGASIDIDGVYSNPAGLAFLPADGLYLSLNIQSAYQTRDIDARSPLFTEEGNRRLYEGTASAPVVPSLFGAYRKGDWTVSGSFAVVGGGGKASFDRGLPMFDTMVMGSIAQASGGAVTPDMYSLNSAMDGRQFIYGVQLGLSYRAADWLSLFAGGRMNYFSGGYEGFLDATLDANGSELVAIALDCDQTGWGLTPVLGADVRLGRWNFGMKYEFITNLNLENKTKVCEVRQNGQALPDDRNVLDDYKDGVNTPNDIPALLSVAAGYEILPSLRASVEYHRFFDKQAGMAGGKQKALTHGTREFLAGAEWDVTRQLTLSAGWQKTDYGLSDDFQSDTSFSCDSYSVGFGASLRMTKHLTMNIAYFWTTYDDYTKKAQLSDNTYSRTNKVFGLGVDYKF